MYAEEVNTIIKIFTVFLICVAILIVGNDIYRDLQLWKYEEVWEKDNPTTYVDGVLVEYSSIDMRYFNFTYDAETNVLKLHDRTRNNSAHYIPIILP